MPEDNKPLQSPDTGAPTPLEAEAIRATEEMRKSSSELMSSMEQNVHSLGRFFAVFGFNNSPDHDTFRIAPHGKGIYDGRVYLLRSPEQIDDSTVFTAITGVGPRQIKTKDQGTILMIQQEIQKNLPQLEPGIPTNLIQWEQERQEIKTSIIDRGGVLNEGLRDSQGTRIQIGPSIFSLDNKSLILCPPEERVVSAMRKSIEESKTDDSHLINEIVITNAKSHQDTNRSLLGLLNQLAQPPPTPIQPYRRT